MQDKKILNEFAAKITKAKILHDSTQATCQKLRREVAQLEKEYATIRSQRQAAENMEKSLKHQLDMTQKAESEANAKCKREENQLEELRENRKRLKREKEIEQHTLMKNKLELEELVTKREQLQATAKALSEKLEGVTSEKEVLQEQLAKTEAAIARYNSSITSLEQEIQQMRNVITKNTVPVHNMSEISQLDQSNTHYSFQCKVRACLQQIQNKDRLFQLVVVMIQLQLIQMSFKKLFIFLGILLLVRSYTQKRGLLILTSDDFPDVITKFPLLLVEFYSSECQLSKQLTPIYNEIAKQFNASGSPLRFANINAKDYATVRAAYEIKQYPTLILFFKSQRIRYRGQKSKEAIVNWLNSKLIPPVTNISPSQLQELKENDKVSIIFYGEIETHEHGTLFQQIARADDYNSYYSVEGTEVETGTVQMLRPFAETISTKLDRHLPAWICEHDRPNVVSFDARTINNIFLDKNVTVILFEPAQQNELLREVFKKAAIRVREQLRKSFIFTAIPHESPYHKSLGAHINITTELSPIVMLDGIKGAKFVLSLGPSEINTETVVSFVADYEGGRLKKYEINEQVVYPKKAKGDDEL